jgi:hypothetical protein
VRYGTFKVIVNYIKIYSLLVGQRQRWAEEGQKKMAEDGAEAKLALKLLSYIE